MTAIEAPSSIPSPLAARRVLSAAQVYAFYQAIYNMRPGTTSGLGGSLLLYQGLDEDGCIAALAGNIAGVATLGIDGDSVALKQAVRDGVCDFLVNNLDEALRILKNEVRKKQPVSVCLQQEFASAIVEMVDRGVQPDFLAVREVAEGASIAAAAETLRARGAVDVARPHDEAQSNEFQIARPLGVSWTALTAPALWLPKIDAIVANIVDQADEERQRWLRFAGRYLGRLTEGTHFLRMTADEAAEFRGLLEDKVASGSIGCAIRMMVDGSESSVTEIGLRP